MGSPLPPDPYLALGLPKDATAGAIKTQYRKLALKFHPDKVQDEAKKKLAADEFHKIQTAYEIVGDEERRARYDAQCKLAELRKDMIDRHAARGADKTDPRATFPRSNGQEDGVRPSATQTRDVPFTYEERRPAYASTEYFDLPRMSSRKAPEAERSSKRSSGRDDRGRTRSSPKESKKSERAERDERSRRTTRDIRRDRDTKPSIFSERDASTDSDDEYERAARRPRGDDEQQRAREAYHEQARRAKEDAMAGYYDNEPRSRKLNAQYATQIDEARDYISRTRKPQESERAERRPSPVRHSSSQTRFAYVKGRDGRPSVVRRESVRPKMSESRRSSARDYEVKPAEEFRRSDPDIVEEPREAAPRRPPGLSQSRSSPAEIKLPYEKPRAQSVQIDRDDAPVPSIRRSETMPHFSSRGRDANRRSKETFGPQRVSTLRQHEEVDKASSGGDSPDRNVSTANKYRYGQAYADDVEYATPDGYRTEVREPAQASRSTHRVTRSPSPVARYSREKDKDRERDRERERDRDRDRDSDRERERERERGARRTTSTRYATKSTSPQRPATLGRTTSTTYAYPSQPATETFTRPSLSRENSSRGMLYGEVKTTANVNMSPKIPSGRHSPPPENVRYADIRPQAGYGYSRRPSEQRVQYAPRNGSTATPVYAR